MDTWTCHRGSLDQTPCVLAELGGVEGGVRDADGGRKDERARLAGGEEN